MKPQCNHATPLQSLTVMLVHLDTHTHTHTSHTHANTHPHLLSPAIRPPTSTERANLDVVRVGCLAAIKDK